MYGLIPIIILFILLAITFFLGKGAMLIAGYNTMSKKDKEKYDEKALCHFMGWIMLLLAISMVFPVFGELLQNNILPIIGFSFIVIVILFMIIYLYAGNRFKKY